MTRHRPARPRGAGSLLLGLLAGACAAEPAPPHPALDADAAPAGAPPIHGMGEIHPPALAPGDTLLGLRVQRLDAQPDRVDGAGWSGSAAFEGSVALTGEFRPHPAHPEVEALCFFADAASAARLPRFPNDRRTPWLCFDNQADARRWLAAPSATGRATIVVDRFHYRYQHTDTHNTARLREVLEGT